MIERFVALCLRRRHLVWAVFFLVAVYGVFSWTRLPVEAYPDISDVSAQVITQVPGLAAEEVEQQITVPLERQLMGAPGVTVMRSSSTFGLSLITLVFKDGVEDYWCRQRIQERIAGLPLPYGAQPGLDPLTSAVGEIYRYTLESRSRSLRELSELQRWTVIPRLKQIPGIADVSNFGGLTTQFLLELEPAKLTAFNLSLQKITDAINANNANAGGSVLDHGEQGFVIRGIGLVRNLEDLGNIVVAQKNGTPVLLKDLGQIHLGQQERHGILGKDGTDDAIEGIVLMLKGENPSRVLEDVHRMVDELNAKALPKDVKVVPYLDRTTLVQATLHTVSHTLIEGILLVLVVLILFLGSPRAAITVAITIPMALLTAFVFMNHLKIPANLLSLGAIDFGIVVDGAVVVMENLLRRREEKEGRPLMLKDAYTTAAQVARPVFFATVIIITAYFPLFSFERVEYKLFSPMAYTAGFSLLGALAVAMALVPSLAYMAYRRPGKVHHNRTLERMKAWYLAQLQTLLARPGRALAICAITLAALATLGATLGRDFLPQLDEGSLWLQVALPPGISLDKGVKLSRELRKATLEFPQVATIVTQLGRTDDGMDPWTPSHIEACVALKPYGTWNPDISKEELIRRMARRFKAIPGVDVGFSQPMIDMVNDKVGGAHSELVVKVFGESFAELRRITNRIKEELEKVTGAADVAVNQEPPLPQVQISVDRAMAARYGINAADIANLVQSGIGGSAIGQVFVEEKHYDVAVRFAGATRSSPEAIGNLVLTSPSGAQIALSQVAKVELKAGESTITREMSRRHLTVKLNLRGRDLSSFLAEAQPLIEKQVPFDATKFEVQWGGQFENQNRAQGRLALILPLTLLIMFALLFAEFRNLRHPALILLAVPLSTLGGLIALHLRGMTLNVSSAVGFIALFGVSVQNAIIMIANLNRHAAGKDLEAGVLRAAGERFRPVLMTATVAALGLLPAALARGLGSDIQRPLATVVVGGLVTATTLTLLVLPVLYLLVERRARGRVKTTEPGLMPILDETAE
jgi:cobalt-zinc-cadmium resistance protein CzcA